MRTNGQATLYLQSNGAYTRRVVDVYRVPKKKLVPTTDGVTLREVNVIFVAEISGLTISSRDYIVPGVCTAELGDSYTLRDLITDQGAQAITSLAHFTDGSPLMHHWELEVQ